MKNAGGGVPFLPDRWPKFFNEFARTGLLGHSARFSGVSPETIRRLRKEVPEFAELFEEAQNDYRESLEMEVHRRAVQGWDEPVYQKGEMVGTIRRHSDSLLHAMLKRHIPEYRDKVTVDASVRGGVMVVPGAPATAEDWEAQYGEKARGTTGVKDT